MCDEGLASGAADKSMTGKKLDFFRGALVDVASEITVARALQEALPGPAVVAVNLVISGRQIDVVIATERSCLLIEAKSSIWPVEGSQNGPWRTLAPHGAVPTRNAYRQALEAKYALRDAFIAWRGQSIGYPDAAIIYAPSLPAGSNLPIADFRVRLGSLADLSGELDRARALAIPLHDWREFFLSCGLEHVHGVEELFDPRFEAHARVLTQYANEFRSSYGMSAAQWVPDPSQSTDGLLDEGPGLLVGGPSGCGKSLLTQALAVGAAQRGDIPVFIAGKNFTGSWSDTVAREISLLIDDKPEVLLRAARQHGRKLLFVLDALNEIPLESRDHALRGLTALSRRLRAQFVLSSNPMPPASIMPLARRVELPAPSLDVKVAIARSLLRSEPDAPLIELLGAVQTGLEASLVAKLGPQNSQRGRYALFECFARSRLGDKAKEGVALLAKFASTLIDQVTFSLSERSFEELERHFEGGTGRALQDAGLVERRSSRVSFSHELFLQAFGAEALVRWAGNDAELIARALDEPINIERRSMIVGAIDSAAVVERILARTTDVSLLVSAAKGECGKLAQDVVRTLLDACLRKLETEIANLCATIVREDSGPRVVFDGLELWAPTERARLQALGKHSIEGVRLERILTISALLDKKLSSERQRLGAEARAAGLLGLRSFFFQCCYVMALAGEVGFEILSRTQPDWSRSVKADTVALADRLGANDLTHGQAYLILRIARSAWGDHAIAQALPSVFRRLWPTAPYHLKLDLLQAAQFSGSQDSNITQALVAVIHELVSNDDHVFITTSAIDALRSLGGLEEEGEEARAGIRDELQRLALNSDDTSLFSAAWGAFSAQFDHPYDWIYYEEWAALDEPLRIALLRMAVRSAPEYTMFMNMALTELAEQRDPQDIEIFRRYAKPPNRRDSIPQDAMKVFVVANMALGLLGERVRSTEGIDEIDDILLTIGEILQIISGASTGGAERRTALEGLWARLETHDVGRSVGVLAEVSEAIDHRDETPKRVFGSPSLAAPLPTPVLRLARKVLDESTQTQGYFEFRDGQLGFAFALQIVSDHGDLSDLTRLRRAAARPSGQAALGIVKKFESRL